MPKLTKLLFVILFMPILSLSAQDSPVPELELQSGPPFTYQVFMNSYEFHIKGEIFSIERLFNGIQVRKTDASTLEILAEGGFSEFTEDVYIEKIQKFNDRIFIFYSFKEKQPESEKLYFREIDLKTATVKKEELLLEVSGEFVALYEDDKFFRDLKYNKFEIYTSQDNSKLMVQYKVKPAGRSSKNDLIGFYIYDNNLENIFNLETEMPYEKKEMKILDYCIDSKGNAFIMTAITKKDEASWLELMKIPTGTSEIQQTKIAFSNITVTDIGLYESNKETVKCAGIYTDIGESATSGFFIFAIGPAGDILNLRKIPFSEEIVKQNMAKKDLKKLTKTEMKNDKKGKNTIYKMDSLVIKEVHTDEDGSSIIIAEQAYVEDAPALKVYHYNNIVITKVTEDHRMVWMNKLAKIQNSTLQESILSYKYFRSGDKHYLIYNDHYENFALKPSEEPKHFVSLNKGYLTAAVIDQAGNMEKKLLLKMEKKTYWWVYTSFLVQTSENEIAFKVYIPKNKLAMVKVRLN